MNWTKTEYASQKFIKAQESCKKMYLKKGRKKEAADYNCDYKNWLKLSDVEYLP